MAMTLIKRVQKFLATYKMDGKEFGKQSVGDKDILMRLIEGKRLSNLEYGRIKNYIFDYSLGKKPKEPTSNKVVIDSKYGIIASTRAHDRMMQIGSDNLLTALRREHPQIVQMLVKKQEMRVR